MQLSGMSTLILLSLVASAFSLSIRANNVICVPISSAAESGTATTSVASSVPTSSVESGSTVSSVESGFATSSVESSSTATSSAASSSTTSTTDTASYCGQYDTVTAGDYTLDLDQWGLSDADSGTDCAQITSQSGSTIAWTATWAWTGSTSVVAYTNVNLNTGIGVQLSEVTSIPTTWSWSSNITSSSVADVAYDMFTSSTADGSNEYEIMVWLSNVNSEPIASSYDSSGDAEAAETNLSIAGQTWDLYSGSNGSNDVYSFLLSSGEDLTDFDGDLLEFFTYLIDNESLSSSQYIITLQAGTEETSGSATLTTSSYTVSIDS